MGSYNCPLSYFFQLYLFLVFGSDYRFVIDWITRNPFRCMAWNEADTKISLPCPYLLERYCALFMYLQVDCMYMSACAVPAEVPEKAFFMHNDLWIRFENQHDWMLEKHTFCTLLLLSVIVVLTSWVVVNLQILEVLFHLAVWIFNFDG